MASTWGLSWGTSWGVSWDRDVTPVPPPPISYGGWAGGNIIRKKPTQEEVVGVTEQVQEIVAEVAKAVLIDTDAEQRQALKDALQAQQIAFKQAYFDELKKQLIKEYMLAAQYRIALKNEEETIVFMMMALA